MILKDGLYVFQNFFPQPHVFTAHNTTIASFQSAYQLWHSHLAHASPKTIKKVLHTYNITYNRYDVSVFRDICVKAKCH